MVNAQQWLDREYPKNGTYNGLPNLSFHMFSFNTGKTRKEIEKIDIWAISNLEGSLKLEGFDNLEDFNCWANRLTELDLTGAPNLKKVNCSSNNLRKLNIKNLERLEELNCSNNQLIELDISGCPNLKSLNVAGNHFNINQVTSQGMIVRVNLAQQNFYQVLLVSDNSQQMAQIEHPPQS